ncbi:MAG: hypothetical protein GWO16_07655, partial [Gammaproteobacteria bacterium]|nr:hypothetical protein [Gammaproteobacteria bacterium]NIR97833.1 hypothetical protein [Gammaproteobacteria bacterium]NIT63530.1 hypothetical protein [Gammaproteobacteria bacterium]NIV20477.1 hypothetical protein [Gammaproteobacteria bacterium]NIY32110.1 hypothetical protein [Gammaproteobacteria bacterium]
VRLPGGSNALAGLTLFQPDFQADPVGAGDSASTTTDDTIAPHVYWVQNEQDWAWGVGLYFPFNDVVEWPADWAGRLEVENVEINIGYLSFSGAYAVNDNLSFGGSLLYIRGEATLEKDTDALAGF